MGRLRRIVAAVLVALMAAPAVASADTIVFRRGADVWVMAPDGTGQRQVTRGERTYEWPSAADDGTILAADSGGWLHRLTAGGEPIGEPIPTAATGATEDFPAETPTHVRISPDGARVAYDQAIGGDLTTLWTPADSTTLAFPNQSAGQEGLVAPSWIGNSRLLLSRDVTAEVEGAPVFSLYTVGAGDNSAAPWFSDSDATWATGFDAAASRSGARIAVMEDDAAESGGVPSRVVMRLFSGSPPAVRCELELEAADTYSSASPTFSPDGSQIAWAESDGIHVATLGDLTDCAAIREQVITLPGAWEPFWSAADIAAAPGTPGAQRLTLRVVTKTRPLRRTVRRRGVTARVTASAPATVRLSLRVGGRVVASGTRRFADAGTRRVRLRLRSAVARRAGRIVLRVSAAGAAPVVVAIRPR
jgi:hypothetical protein